MKKIIIISSLIGLTACQAPYTRNVYQATGPRVCVEYYDSFRCSTPQRVWNETVYPKNELQMEYGTPPVYIPYQTMNMNRAIYGNY